MKESLIVSVIGPDRPGLVEQLSRVVTEAGGNWEGSRLVQLGGQFAGMVQVVIHDTALGGLREALASLEDSGLRVSVVHSGKSSTDEAGAAEAGAAEAGATEGTQITLEVVGQDRGGIVAAISKALAEAGANVIELSTDCREAAWSGERHFFTIATVAVPANMEPDEIRERVEAVADDLMVEIGGE